MYKHIHGDLGMNMILINLLYQINFEKKIICIILIIYSYVSIQFIYIYI